MFVTAPFISFRSGYSLRSQLVSAKVYPLIIEKPLLRCGNSRCETWLNIQETNTFQDFVTKKVHESNHHFHCDSRCIIYFISCNSYSLQYVASTVEKIRDKVEQL